VHLRAEAIRYVVDAGLSCLQLRRKVKWTPLADSKNSATVYCVLFITFWLKSSDYRIMCARGSCKSKDSYSEFIVVF